MTNEERNELVLALRSFAHDEHSLCSYAADEIERLSADLSLANAAFDKSTTEIERLTEELERLRK